MRVYEETDYKKAIQKRIRELRSSQPGFSLKQVAEAVPMQYTFLSRVLNQSGPQLKPDVMTCFDLEMPADFTPRANDGEVEAFELWPVQRVFETVRDTNQFKYNCNLVLIDFFVRHGLIAADDPTFVAIVAGLRQMRR